MRIEMNYQCGHLPLNVKGSTNGHFRQANVHICDPAMNSMFAAPPEAYGETLIPVRQIDDPQLNDGLIYDSVLFYEGVE